MIYTVHPPAIFARLPTLQDRPRPSNCAANIAFFVDQPNTTSAQRYGRLIDLFPCLIASLPLPSLSNSPRNHDVPSQSLRQRAQGTIPANFKHGSCRIGTGVRTHSPPSRGVVRNGSKIDIPQSPRHVRFTPRSRHRAPFCLDRRGEYFYSRKASGAFRSPGCFRRNRSVSLEFDS